MILLTTEILMKAMPHVAANINANKNFCGYTISQIVELFNKYAKENHIDTKLRWVHFLANIAVETGELRRTEENLNYSAERLAVIFPKHFDSVSAKSYDHDPQKIANKVYGGRYGNNAPGDGWKYRGRGCFQYTFKANYQEYAKWCGYDVVKEPDLLSKPVGAIRSAARFFDKHNLNALADIDGGLLIRKKINGGTNGWTECQQYIKLAKQAFGILTR